MQKKHLLLLISLLIGIGMHAQIPNLYISTPDGSDILTKEWHKGCHVAWTNTGTEQTDSCNDVSIRARGHSTFRHPKKPFAIRFSNPVELFGMKKASRWVLLANFMDHSLLRNSLALTIANKMSLPYTSHFQNVNLYVNGEWRGCYLLCEGVDVASGRVEIPEGGWLIEGDTYDDDKAFLGTPIRHLPFYVRYPKKVKASQIESIGDFMAAMERSLYQDEDDEWLSYIDLNSFADWWILHELCMNAEPNGPRSCYMLYDGKQLKAGPAWDFDLSLNPVGLDEGGDIRPFRFHRQDVVELTVDSSFCSKALWYDALFRKPQFRNKISERWSVLRDACINALQVVDSIAVQMKDAAIKDQERWNSLDPARFDTSSTWEEAYENLRTTYLRRITWMDNFIANHSVR